MSPPAGDSGAQRAVGLETLEFGRSAVFSNRVHEFEQLGYFRARVGRVPGTEDSKPTRGGGSIRGVLLRLVFNSLPMSPICGRSTKTF